MKSRTDRGFMMVALLIGMGVAAIMMTAALPKWGHEAQRQREDDLVFRGEQYARAIAMYAMRNRGALPMDLDVLVSQKYLRKKWKDPVTDKDFFLVGIGVVQPTSLTGLIGTSSSQAAGVGSGNMGGASQIATTGNPGISGVRSISTATSIKIYNQQQQYNLWQFDGPMYAQTHYGVNLNQLANGGRGGQGGRGGDAGGRGGQQVGPGRAGGDGRTGAAGPGRGGGAPPAPPPGGATTGRGRGGE